MNLKVDSKSFKFKWIEKALFLLVIINAGVKASLEQCDSEQKCSKHESNNFNEGELSTLTLKLTFLYR